MKEFSDFMESLVEKKADGNEISRGMNKHDKSKKQKDDTYVSKEVKKNANGSSTETHYDQAGDEAPPPEQAPPEAPPPEPLQPGMQVTYGNKQIDPSALDAKTVKIDISGEKDSLNMSPRLSKDPKAPPM